ncbi:unnamed protein product [Oreochromis niloticus]|nr:unnamed protein product [Mustela putorius furo]
MKTLLMILLLINVSTLALVLVVEVNEGERSVPLPCQYSGVIPEINPTVIWNRNGFDPKSVHIRREGGDDLRGQNQRYSGRTSMRPDALDTLDFTLTLRKPELTDSGNYTCSISDGRREQRLRDVQLQVKDHQIEVNVEKDSDSVILPCKTKPDLPEDTTVEWTHSDTELMIVHVYSNRSDQLKKQDGLYRDRTKMNKDLLRTGDLSLTLKYPTERDSGGYICTIYRDKDILRQKVVLQVKDCQVEVEEGVDSVQLPFKTTGDLPGDTKVEWRRIEPKTLMTVHIYQNGSDQPDKQHQVYRDRTKMNEDLLKTGDLSLTLKHPTERDSGRYRCEAYRRESNIWREKTVLLRVKDILVNFYRCTIESILTNCITVWYGNCSASDRKALQRVVKTAQRIAGAPLPAIKDIYRKRCLKRAGKIIKDPSHPSHRLFTLLPSGRRYRSLRTKTTRALLGGEGALGSQISGPVARSALVQPADGILQAPRHGSL